jgi:hypothetical protein
MSEFNFGDKPENHIEQPPGHDTPAFRPMLRPPASTGEPTIPPEPSQPPAIIPPPGRGREALPRETPENTLRFFILKEQPVVEEADIDAPEKSGFFDIGPFMDELPDDDAEMWQALNVYRGAISSIKTRYSDYLEPLEENGHTYEVLYSETTSTLASTNFSVCVNPATDPESLLALVDVEAIDPLAQTQRMHRYAVLKERCLARLDDPDVSLDPKKYVSVSEAEARYVAEALAASEPATVPASNLHGSVQARYGAVADERVSIGESHDAAVTYRQRMERRIMDGTPLLNQSSETEQYVSGGIVSAKILPPLDTDEAPIVELNMDYRDDDEPVRHGDTLEHSDQTRLDKRVSLRFHVSNGEFLAAMVEQDLDEHGQPEHTGDTILVRVGHRESAMLNGAVRKLKY